MNKKSLIIIIMAVLSCISMYWVEQVLKLNYVNKSLLKILFFLVIPFILCKILGINTKIKGKISMFSIGLGLICLFVIISAYICLKNNIDFNMIIKDLNDKLKINKSNFIYVGMYICFVNSLLEEIFFRKFIFLNLYNLNLKKFSSIYSALLFSIYHISIFKSWFNPYLIILAITGLLAVGLIFNYIDKKYGSFINSYIIHIFADLGIILVGLRLFEII